MNKESTETIWMEGGVDSGAEAVILTLTKSTMNGCYFKEAIESRVFE